MTNEEIKAQHLLGLRGLWQLYPTDLLRKGIKWPLILTSIVFAGSVAARFDSVKLVTNISDSIVSVMPSLLGFLLGGYTILISFANNDLLQSLTRRTNNRQVSVFQLLSCIFALTILMQSVTLVLALVARFSLLISFEWTFMSNLNGIISVANYLFSYLLMFMLLYTIVAFKDIISNIFNLTQVFHLSLLKKRLAEEEKVEGPEHPQQV